MSHPCKSNFWGDPSRDPFNDAAGVLSEWLDWLALIAPPPPAPPPLRTMSYQTWMTMCLVQFEIERATGTPHAMIPPWNGGGDFLDSDEATFRAVAQVFLGLFVADQWDHAGPNLHSQAVPDWIDTGIPEASGVTYLKGAAAPFPDPASLLGKVRNALGS